MDNNFNSLDTRLSVHNALHAWATHRQSVTSKNYNKLERPDGLDSSTAAAAAQAKSKNLYNFKNSPLILKIKISQICSAVFAYWHVDYECQVLCKSDISVRGVAIWKSVTTHRHGHLSPKSSTSCKWSQIHLCFSLAVDTYEVSKK